MKKPVIVITAGKQNQAAVRGEMQSITSGCNLDYLTSVVRAGGAPVILPCLSDKSVIEAVLETADGVLLTGGGDVLSLTYGEEPHPRSAYQDSVRDAMEMEVIRLTQERNIPLLGICRGVQVLNVAFGGTLIQDIPSQIPNAVKHYSEGLDVTLLHTIEIEADSQLAQILQAGSIAVNSYHHQAVKEVGAGLGVNCRARDGVIEGLEAVDGRPILGVQFHPEECTATYPQFQPIFDWLVQRASSKLS